MIRCCILLLTTVILFSCKNKSNVPSGILPRDKMEIVLKDIFRVNAFTHDFIKKDSAKNELEENVKLQKQVFQLHKVTKDEFYNSYNYYNDHPDIMKAMLDSIVNSNARERNNRPVIRPIKADN